MKRRRTHKPLANYLLLLLKILAAAIGGLTILVGALLFVLPRPVYKTGFKNLQELQAVAQRTNELEPMSNNNTLKPEFSSYYERYKPTLKFVLREKLTYLLSLVYLAPQPAFSPGFFKTLIENITKEHEKKEQAGGTIIGKITSTENSKFIIFGNLQGSFHSFVRDLEKLKELDLISDKLQLTQPDTYIFFMGDVISRSCYSMETMAAVARITQANPEKAFYLKGNHETSNYWQEHTLKTELQLRASHLSKELIPLATQVNKFFETLPDAFYITIPNKQKEFIRISDSGRTQNEVLNENTFASFLTQKDAAPVSFFVIKEKLLAEESENPIIIKAIFRGEKKRESFQPMQGLRFLAPDIDAVAWNILSCPNYVYQRAIKFYHDAFVILEAGKTIDDWKIQLYSRDSRTKNQFKKTTYFMMSGIDATTNKKLELDQPKQSKNETKKPARSLVPTANETKKEESTKKELPPEKPEKIEEKKVEPIKEKPVDKNTSTLVPAPPPLPPQEIEKDEVLPPPAPITQHQPAQAPQYPSAPIYQTIIYPQNCPAHPQNKPETIIHEATAETAPAKNEETLAKIHDLLLKLTTTLDTMQKNQEQPINTQMGTTP